MDDQEFQRLAEAALTDLKRALIKAEEAIDMEVEEQSGAMHIGFEDPPARFVVSPNSAVRQIWISALSTSFKLDWSPERSEWVLGRTGESLRTLMARLVTEQSGQQVAL